MVRMPRCPAYCPSLPPFCVLRAFRGYLFFAVIAGCLAAGPAPAWRDEFNQPAGSAPDSAKWVYDLGNRDGWGNAELEFYTDTRANSFVTDDRAATDGKVLVIRAVRGTGGRYTSARLKTLGKFATRYGRIEARLKLPRGQGIWPAFWMLGANIDKAGWPECGEIDIMESIGHRPGVLFGTMHGPGYSGAGGVSGTTMLPDSAALGDAYHVYGVEWSPGKITWLFDGKPYFTATPASLPSGARWVFDDGPFFILLNLAVGGGWPGYPDATTVFPQELRIDYVRVYGSEAAAQTKDQGPKTTDRHP
jgi:beta-glucanase (GH16 family)